MSKQLAYFFKQSLPKLFLIALVTLLLIIIDSTYIVKPVFAQAFFENPRQFSVEQSCNATTSIRRETDPVSLAIGSSYKALGENKMPGGTHAFIEIDGARKWVALSCGKYQGETHPIPSEPTTAFLPFFDEIDNPIRVRFGGMADITPVPPQLTKFDRAVIKVCGEPGKRATRREFVDLMNDNPDILEKVNEYVGQGVFASRPPTSSTSDFLQDLTDAWFSNTQGFNHIFCGEPVPGGKIGGLHFWGRYLELQEASLAGRLPGNTSKEEVLPGVIYTLGVEMMVDGNIASSEIKGYGLTLSAEDILKLTTKAFYVEKSKVKSQRSKFKSKMLNILS